MRAGGHSMQAGIHESNRMLCACSINHLTRWKWKKHFWGEWEDDKAAILVATQLHGGAPIPSFLMLSRFWPHCGVAETLWVTLVSPCRGEGGWPPALVSIAFAGAQEGVQPQPGEHCQAAPQGETPLEPSLSGSRVALVAV